MNYLWLFMPLFLFSAPTPIRLSDDEKSFIAQNPSVRVCVNPNLAPFEFLTPEGLYEGIGAELLNHVAKNIGLRLEIVQTYSWKESLEKARKNECDIVNFIPQTLEFNKWLLFSEPLFSDDNVLLTRNEHPYIGNLKKRSNATLALSEDAALFERLSYTFPALTIFSVETQEDALFLVLNQKIDMTVRSSTIVSYALRKHGLLNLKISGILEDFQNHYKVGIVGNNERLRDILNKGIKSLSAYEKESIVNAYVPIVVEKPMDEKAWYVLIAIALGVVMILFWNYSLRKQVKKAVAQNLLNQKMMIQQAKQAELGQLIGNISHQWREPLSNLSGVNLMLMGLLEHRHPIDTAFLLQKFKEVENTLEFMSQTMQNFLEFYKPSTVQHDFSVLESLQQTFSLVETNLLAHKISITISGDKERTLFGIKNEWMQVWLNLITNAIRALQSSGGHEKTITITIEKERIRICDNAKGAISASDITHGVGLNMCMAIVKKYHYTLSFSNTSLGVCASIEPNKELLTAFKH